jgi:predicted secreted protein
MATNLFHGRKGIVQTAATSSGTAANFGRVRNFSLDVNAETIDVTNMDSSGWRELLDGTKSWEFTAEALWLSTAATTKQDDLRSALSSGARQAMVQVPEFDGSGFADFPGLGIRQPLEPYRRPE